MIMIIKQLSMLNHLFCCHFKINPQTATVVFHSEFPDAQSTVLKDCRDSHCILNTTCCLVVLK